jgi:hypothetical protein
MVSAIEARSHMISCLTACKQKIGFAIFLLFAIFTFFYCLYAPIYGWDMIAYIALAKQMMGSSAADAHAYTYQSLRETLPDYLFNELASGRSGHPSQVIEYRVKMLNDPSAFQEQLRFYNVRVLYILLLAGIIKFGLNPILATSIISASFAASVTMIMWLFSRNIINIVYFPALVVSIGWSGLLSIGKYSTPDAMATFGVVLLFAMHCHSSRATFFICPFLVMIRNDLSVLSIIYLIYIFVVVPDQQKPALFSAVATAVVLYTLNTYFDYPGWKKVFYFTFVKWTINPLTEAMPLTLMDYMQQLVRGIRSSMFDPHFSAFLSLAFLLIAYTFSYVHVRDMYKLLYYKVYSLFFVCMVYVLVRFLLFPVAWERFYVPVYLWTAFTLIVAIHRDPKQIDERRDSLELYNQNPPIAKFARYDQKTQF